MLWQLKCFDSLNALTAWMLWQLNCFDSLNVLTAWMLWQLECLDSLNALTAWMSQVHDSPECMTVPSTWQSQVHDSHKCMTVTSAWQSQVHDSQKCMTVKCAWQSRVHELKFQKWSVTGLQKHQTGDGLTYSHCSTVVWLTDRWTDMLNCRDAIASKNHPPLLIANYILYLTIISHFIIYYYDVFASFWVHDSFHCFTVWSAWQFWVHDSFECMKSQVHDSPKCMTVLSAWELKVTVTGKQVSKLETGDGPMDMLNCRDAITSKNH